MLSVAVLMLVAGGGPAAAAPCPPPSPVALHQVPGGGPVLSLTIDDGPHPQYTPRMLEVLAQHDVRATFFVIGRNVRAYPELAQRIVDEGHLLANHTYGHPTRPDHMDVLPIEQRVAQIDRATREIQAAPGSPPASTAHPGSTTAARRPSNWRSSGG